MMLWNYVVQSLLIWALTVIGGSVMLAFSGDPGFFVIILLMSSIFSLPGFFMLMPALYILSGMETAAKRVFFSLLAVLTICSIVLLLFFLFLREVPRDGFIALFIPYILSALISFILVVEIAEILKHKSSV